MSNNSTNTTKDKAMTLNEFKPLAAVFHDCEAVVWAAFNDVCSAVLEAAA